MECRATPTLVLQGLSSKIDNIKPKLSDGEFLEIMNTMGELYKHVNHVKHGTEDQVINITRSTFEILLSGMRDLHEERLEQKRRLDTLEEKIDKVKRDEDREGFQEQIGNELRRHSEQVDIEDEFFAVDDSDREIILEVEETEEEEETTSSSSTIEDEEETTSSSSNEQEDEQETTSSSSSDQEDDEVSFSNEEDYLDDADDEEHGQHE